MEYQGNTYGEMDEYCVNRLSTFAWVSSGTGQVGIALFLYAFHHLTVVSGSHDVRTEGCRGCSLSRG
jgi:hypothetical protein